MLSVNAKIKRENLIQEIFNALRQWPALERRIFAQAHYHGQSLEAISRFHRLDVEEVAVILKRCDCRLHTSLREFRKSSCAALASKAKKILGIT
jgi:DNA-directed RNA polymerase specialized sigma24 family protein